MLKAKFKTDKLNYIYLVDKYVGKNVQVYLLQTVSVGKRPFF